MNEGHQELAQTAGASYVLITWPGVHRRWKKAIPRGGEHRYRRGSRRAAGRYPACARNVSPEPRCSRRRMQACARGGHVGSREAVVADRQVWTPIPRRRGGPVGQLLREHADRHARSRRSPGHPPGSGSCLPAMPCMAGARSHAGRRSQQGPSRACGASLPAPPMRTGHQAWPYFPITFPTANRAGYPRVCPAPPWMGGKQDRECMFHRGSTRSFMAGPEGLAGHAEATRHRLILPPSAGEIP